MIQAPDHDQPTGAPESRPAPSFRNLSLSPYGTQGSGAPSPSTLQWGPLSQGSGCDGEARRGGVGRDWKGRQQRGRLADQQRGKRNWERKRESEENLKERRSSRHEGHRERGRGKD